MSILEFLPLRVSQHYFIIVGLTMHRHCYSLFSNKYCLTTFSWPTSHPFRHKYIIKEMSVASRIHGYCHLLPRILAKKPASTKPKTNRSDLLRCEQQSLPHRRMNLLRHPLHACHTRVLHTLRRRQVLLEDKSKWTYRRLAREYLRKLSLTPDAPPHEDAPTRKISWN